MAQNKVIQNSNTTRRNTRVFEKATTTNATPEVVGSVPLSQAFASFFEVDAIAVKSDLSAAQYMTCRAGFRRTSGGNIVRATSNSGSGLPYTQTDGDFSPKKPSIDLVANTGTQSIDITVTGIAATTINWYFDTLSIQNLA